MSFFSELVSPLLNFTHSPVARDVLSIVIYFSPVLLALLLFEIMWPVWLNYVRSEYFFKEKYSVVEIRLPKETLKSPLAMEAFLSSLHQVGGESSFYDKYWLGKTRPWFSLELASIEGNVKFFIWMRSSWKSFVSSALYAHFPGIEVHEMDDYTGTTFFDPKKNIVWGTEFEFAKSNVYPIKTYVDYGLDKDPKEEFKVDPIAPLLEFLGSIGANQQLWIQFMIRAHKDDQPKPGSLIKTYDKWREDAKEEINKILIRDEETKVAGELDANGRGQQLAITEIEKDTVSAIERNVGKLGYDVGIRGVYVADKQFFNSTNIPGLIGIWKQYSHPRLNSIKFNTKRWHPSMGDPWQDFKNFRKNRASREILEAYKRRSFFFPPYHSDKSKILVMSSESLATLYHFPGQVSQTPTLARVPSKKSEAPANLPI